MQDDFFDSPLSRRRFLYGASGLAGLLTMAQAGACGIQATKTRLGTNPFTLGVASGDPLPDGVVLWTRLALDPLNGGGMPTEDIPVRWRVARDEKMKDVVQSGTAIAPAALAHSVHVELTGLDPGRWYWYQFSVGDSESTVGRTRTAPAIMTPLHRLPFAFVSCQAWPDGYYTSYQHLAKEDLHLIVHLGDYIYEGGISADPTKPRKHNSPECADLNAYRNRYALYKTDPHLQAAHAAFPWVVTWDDHEVENNYAELIRDNQNPPGDMRVRRAAAYQAYYEHQPLRRASLPSGPDMLLYRRLAFGNLAEFSVLDTRQYRTVQPCKGQASTDCIERLRVSATLPGRTQEKWLINGLDRSQTRWNVLAQQVFMAQRDYTQGPDKSFSIDAWDGYPASRDRLLKFVEQRKLPNMVVLTGDVHANWVADLKADFNEPKSRILGSEFIGTSITSTGDGAETTATAQRVLSENPHIKWHNARRGYVRCVLTPDRWQSDYRVVPFVSKPGAPVTTAMTFVVENGKPGVQKA